MLGIDVKRGVASTLERVFNASGNRFDKLEVLWSGKTAGIIHSKFGNALRAKVLFPTLDETKVVPKETFNNLIGYALHELGHAWYTENEPWDRARQKYGSFVSNLINGLEDPRIERLVIESGRAPNARTLFENLVNSILKRDGYVKPDDKKNIPFLLAVEGRRLNGYAIIEPSIVDASPWAADIRWALRKAKNANDTKAIAKIAIELFKRIREQEQPKPQPQDQDQDGQPQGQQDESEGEPQDGPDDGDGQGDSQDEPQDGSDDSGEGSPSDDSKDGPKGDSDANGADGDDGDDSDADGDSDGDSDGDANDDGEGGQSSGKADESFDGGRDVEPSSFIADELGEHCSKWEDVTRPAVGKPVYATFDWR